MNLDGRKRVVISHIQPVVEEGEFAIKRIIGDEVIVSADIFADGHTDIAVELLFSPKGMENWNPIKMDCLGNDRWQAKFTVSILGRYLYKLQGWIDHFSTWQKDLEKKFNANVDISVELMIGLEWIEKAIQLQKNPELVDLFFSLKKEKNKEKTYQLAIDKRLSELMYGCFPNKRWVVESKVFSVVVDPIKAGFSSWYEMFPRSCAPENGVHGTFKDCEQFLPTIAQMGFDVLYLPPIHPIGHTNRKGKNNQPIKYEKSQSVSQTVNQPGSPWAIGSVEGGHYAIHSELGTVEEFEHLIEGAKKRGIEIALDIAFQCSPDHPYLIDHPEWFTWRPDGTIQHAENPPKKYEDIVPFDFETENWQELWSELRNVVKFWVEKGISIFRVDNPHTKPFGFWDWLINSIKEEAPEVIFLSEAFTRPKVMYRLAEIGFTQSYTYFTWRRTKKELMNYMKELTSSEIREYFRPHFWPNTPDILSEELQQDGRAAFMIRFFLAATLSSNYGIYGPAYELMVKDAILGTEEYLDAEKYEIKSWDRKAITIKDFIIQINRIRKENLSLQSTQNIKLYEIDNDQLFYYGKFSTHNELLFIVNLDPYKMHLASFKVPLQDLRIEGNTSYRVHELLTDRKYVWEGEMHEISLDPKQFPVAIFRIHKRVRRENDFDYFM